MLKNKGFKFKQSLIVPAEMRKCDLSRSSELILKYDY